MFVGLRGTRENADATGSDAAYHVASHRRSGAIEAENWRDAMPDDDANELVRGIPAGFVRVVDDIADAALFLASSESSYVVGQTIVVDGGAVSWMPFSDDFRKPTGERFGHGYAPEA